ncbi:hypothetical protein CPB83DRAFT_201350 [Crepidotus variabilis]|uniref:Uncharacterized protein n=1 Tax=Crepidotus variabilis TaxID=179855 RepID=A0A9P6EK59_9AGAR|nr:hypothetical protein CPB83DRAFT_201350 [Crepidotus variabilis]
MPIRSPQNPTLPITLGNICVTNNKTVHLIDPGGFRRFGFRRNKLEIRVSALSYYFTLLHDADSRRRPYYSERRTYLERMPFALSAWYYRPINQTLRKPWDLSANIVPVQGFNDQLLSAYNYFFMRPWFRKPPARNCFMAPNLFPEFCIEPRTLDCMLRASELCDHPLISL